MHVDGHEMETDRLLPAASAASPLPPETACCDEKLPAYRRQEKLRPTARRAVMLLAAPCVLWLIVVATSSFGQGASDHRCAAQQTRTDCGYLGIAQQQCQAKGCCWGPTHLLGSEPWCFYGVPRACTVATSRIDCGYIGITEQQCQSRGCCWSPAERSGLPWCFYPGTDQGNYVISAANRTGPNAELELQLVHGHAPQLGPDLATLRVVVEAQSAERVHIKIVPVTDRPRWEIPEELIPPPPPPPAAADLDPAAALYRVRLPEEGQYFSVAVERAGSGEVLLDSRSFGLVFKDQFMQFATALDSSSSLYGLGESTLSTGLRLPRNGKIITMWNSDVAASGSDVTLYGSHPFYLDVRQDGKAHGVFMKNSNGMDVVLDADSLTYRLIGGVIDLYIFMGPSPEQVVQQYQEVIGKPAMPPYWSLGYHQCRWGYHELQTLRKVVDNYAAANIPLEVIWSDIDWMDKYRDFEFDEDRYPAKEVRTFVEKLHAAQQRWVPIIDCGIPKSPGDESYDEGVKDDIFIKDITGEPYLGAVWPGPTHWPDFMHPKTGPWWERQLARMHDAVPFDGIWIDMNEASNFCTGEVCKLNSLHGSTAAGGAAAPLLRHAVTPLDVRSANGSSRLGGRRLMDAADCAVSCTQPSDGDTLSNPPYSINVKGRKARLGDRTLPVSATHYGGVREYDVHNLFGLMEARATAAAIKQIKGTRPFILSRSSFPSLGRYGAHWTGDNAATWNDLRWSINGLLNSNMWGIPLAGSDICGFMMQTNEELCARWISAGAFYTFVRNHNDWSSPPQELYLWPAVAAAARRALGLRYQLLPYLYTCFYTASTAGGTVARPVFWAHADDESARGVDQQWMLGDAVLVSPVLAPDQSDVSAYFPAGVWYSVWDYTSVQGPAEVTLTAPLGEVPVHIKGGNILPMQRAGNTTTQVRSSPITLLLALPSSPGNDMLTSASTGSESAGLNSSSMDGSSIRPAAVHQGFAEKENLTATGLLYMDSGDTMDVAGPDSLLVAYVATAAPSTQQGSLTAEVKRAGADSFGLLLIENLVVFGMVLPDQGEQKLSFMVNGTRLPQQQLAYDGAKHVLRVSGLSMPVNQALLAQWSLQP